MKIPVRFFWCVACGIWSVLFLIYSADFIDLSCSLFRDASQIPGPNWPSRRKSYDSSSIDDIYTYVVYVMVLYICSKNWDLPIHLKKWSILVQN